VTPFLKYLVYNMINIFSSIEKYVTDTTRFNRL